MGTYLLISIIVAVIFKWVRGYKSSVAEAIVTGVLWPLLPLLAIVKLLEYFSNVTSQPAKELVIIEAIARGIPEDFARKTISDGANMNEWIEIHSISSDFRMLPYSEKVLYIIENLYNREISISQSLREEK